MIGFALLVSPGESQSTGGKWWGSYTDGTGAEGTAIIDFCTWDSLGYWGNPDSFYVQRRYQGTVIDSVYGDSTSSYNLGGGCFEVSMYAFHIDAGYGKYDIKIEFKGRWGKRFSISGGYEVRPETDAAEIHDVKAKTDNLQSGKLVQSWGTVFEGFENAQEWEVAGTNARKHSDEDHYTEGNSGINLVSVGGNEASITKRVKINLAHARNFIFDAYVADTMAGATKSGSGLPLASLIPSARWDEYGHTKVAEISKSEETEHIKFRMYTDTSGTPKYFEYSIDHSSINPGWNSFVLLRDDDSELTNSPDWIDDILWIRMIYDTQSTNTCSVTFDNFALNYKAKGAVFFHFDDGSPTWDTVAADILAAHGFRANCFVITGQVGAGGWIDTSQLRNLDTAYHWEIGSHTTQTGSLVGESRSNLHSYVDGAITWLQDRDYVPDYQYFSAPYGAVDHDVEAKVRHVHRINRVTLNDKYQPHYRWNGEEQYWWKCLYVVRADTNVVDIMRRIRKAMKAGTVVTVLLHIIRHPAETPAGDVQWWADSLDLICDSLAYFQGLDSLRVMTLDEYFSLMSWDKHLQATGEEIREVRDWTGAGDNDFQIHFPPDGSANKDSVQYWRVTETGAHIHNGTLKFHHENTESVIDTVTNENNSF
jgi:peptidoglycan/xylan/chitin deacetylase (PgdA/CDA1 family)